MQPHSMDRLIEKFNEKAISFLQNEPLTLHTSFKIGGAAQVFVLPKNKEQLCTAVRICKEQSIRYYLLGKGSNSLFSDAGFAGVVICTCGMEEGIVPLSETSFEVDAGVSLAKLAQKMAQLSLAGMEFAFGIPGTLGGAIYMNAGAYGGEMKDVVTSVTFLDEQGQVRTLLAAELGLSYRTSVFECNPGWTILSARITLQKGQEQTIRETMAQNMQKRKDKQPLEWPSAGSTFKRPEGFFAAALIEECGLKGRQVGGAAVSEKHSGFVVNLGGATCADVVALTEEVIALVKEKTGVTLEREIRVVE